MKEINNLLIKALKKINKKEKAYFKKLKKNNKNLTIKNVVITNVNKEKLK